MAGSVLYRCLSPTRKRESVLSTALTAALPATLITTVVKTSSRYLYALPQRFITLKINHRKDYLCKRMQFSTSLDVKSYRWF